MHWWKSIRAVQRGEARLHPDIMRKVMEKVARQPGISDAADGAQLTQREGSGNPPGG